MGLKREVLICIDWFLPGYKAGGPIKSVANIVNSLHEVYNFSIICGNTDYGVTEPYDDILPNLWIQKDSYRVMYLDRQHQTVATYNKVLREQRYDIIYLNSLFSIRFTLFPILSCKSLVEKPKIILAPRGMLGKGALALKKHKKGLFLYLVKQFRLFRGVTWHASTEVEADEIRQVFGNETPVFVATNISVAALKPVKPSFKTADNTCFFFLSRISPKKNLLGAIQLLVKINLKNRIQFKIIGPVEDESYWLKCQQEIKKLPSNVEVEYLGAVPNYHLGALLVNYHFLFLPTFSENFGHVIVESWEAGCPVILSDQTPWRNLARENIGWDIPLENEEEFLNILYKCVLMEQEEYSNLSKRTHDYLRKRVITPKIIEQNKALFNI